MENKSHALAAGSFVLLLLALLAAAAVWLTRETRTQRSFELSGNVNVAGLQPQASVRYRGVAIGKVSAIALDPQTRGNVLVRIAVDDAAPITTSTYATLGVQGITGLAFIALDDATPGSPTLATTDQQPARITLREGWVQRLSLQGERLMAQLEQNSQQLNALLSPQNQRTLMTTIDQLGRAASDLQRLSAQARQSWPALTESAQATLLTLQTTSQRVGDSADVARNAVLDLRRMNERLTSRGGTLDKINLGLDALVATEQTLRLKTLPTVQQVLQDAAHSTRQIGALAQTLRTHPQALLLGAPTPQPGPGEAGFDTPPSSLRP